MATIRLKLLLTLLALGLALLLWPKSTHAYSVQALSGTALEASTTQNLYRLRSLGKTWQLSAATADQISDQPIFFASQLFLAVKTGNSWQLTVSKTGLDYQAVAGLVGDNIQLIRRGPLLFVASQTGPTINLAVIHPDSTVTALPNLGLTNLAEANQLTVFNNQIIYGAQLNSFLQIKQFDATASSWTILTSLNCPGALLGTSALPGFSCQPGQFFYPVTTDNWQPLFPSTIQNLTQSATTIAASDAANNLYLWQNNSLTTYALTLGSRTISQIKLLNDRIFLKLSDSSWQEFNPNGVSLSLPPGDVNTVFAADNQTRLFGKIGANYYFSDGPADWHQLTTEGDFSATKKVTGGWLAWLPNGSVVQFAADNSTAFHKVTSAWAASSRIQSVYSQADAGFILLLNSSSNPNLYQSTDFQNWSRTTLPTTVTYAVSIGQTRALSINSLVEVSGVISVPQGAVSSETLYLQDPTGGLQIFLDSSKGTLPAGTNKLAVADGQISSSQTKHVVLSALDDFSLGANQTLTLGQLGIDDLANNLGWATTVQAVINDTSNDYYLLTTGTGTVKFHFSAGSLNFTKGSTVKLPLVTDYNSSSGQIETWYIGSGAVLISAPPTSPPVSSTPTVTATTSSSTATVVTAVAKTTTKAKTASATTTSSVAVGPLAKTTQPLTKKLALPVDVSATKTNDTNDAAQTTTMTLASFLSGALAMRGRRLSALLRW